MGFQLRFLTEVRSIVKFKLDDYRRIKKCCTFLNAHLLANIGADTAENELNDLKNDNFLALTAGSWKSMDI